MGHPGRYFGGPVPLEPFVPSWVEGQGTSKDLLSLPVELSRCLSAPPPSSNVEFADGWVRMKVPNDECTPTGSCPLYRVVKRISRGHCGSLATHLSDSCFELRLVETADPVRYGNNVGIFGIVKDQTSGKTYVVPLVNFRHSLNEALNYVDTLQGAAATTDSLRLCRNWGLRDYIMLRFSARDAFDKFSQFAVSATLRDSQKRDEADRTAQAKADEVNREFDRLIQQIEAMRAHAGSCFGKGYIYGKKVAELYASTQKMIAEKRKAVAEGLDEVLARNRTREEERSNFER